MAELFRADYRDIRTYGGDSKGFAVDLSDNTNQWGTPPAAERALRAAADSMLRGYPAPYGESLKDAIASYAGVAANQVATGTGSDDILDCAFRALARPGDQVAYQSPTFVMVPTFARTNGLVPVPVSLTSEFDLDADAMLATDAQIMYICSPNNPTGNALSRDAIREVVDNAPGWVVIDEAYVDFAEDDAVEFVHRSNRVLVARTFSKAFGLAGARVGYGIGSPELILEVEKARGPYKLTAFGEQAARAALVDDIEWVREKAKAAIAERDWLRDQLAARGIPTIPSQANFLFAAFAGAQAVAARMQACSVAVRAFAGLPQIDETLKASGGEALRITVAPRPMLERMLEVLDEARNA